MIDEYDFDDDEVTALWDGRLPMDRVLKTLQGEIERHKQTHAQRAAAIARAEAAEAELAALREQLADMMYGEAYGLIREHPEIDEAIDRAVFGPDEEEQIMTHPYIDNPTDPNPERDLESGASFPFDAPDEWMERDDRDLPPPPAVDWAHAAARGIIANLRDRRGIKQELQIYNIDEDVRAEIVTAIAAIARKAAEAEIAALRKQLAAHEWRPVSEPPETAGVYQTFTMSPIIADHAIYESDGTWYHRYANPDFWRPVTPPDAPTVRRAATLTPDPPDEELKPAPGRLK